MTWRHIARARSGVPVPKTFEIGFQTGFRKERTDGRQSKWLLPPPNPKRNKTIGDVDASLNNSVCHFRSGSGETTPFPITTSSFRSFPRFAFWIHSLNPLLCLLSISFTFFGFIFKPKREPFSSPSQTHNPILRFSNSREMDENLIDDIIRRLVAAKNGRTTKQVQLTEAEIRQLCASSKEIFLSQPNLLELEAPIKICGDVHGQYSDLLRLFEYGGYPPEANYLFLGDYVDRGKQSIETICLLLAYKVKYKENFFLLRGNHECASINRIYGFYDECKRRFNVRIWKTFTECFNCLPVAALIDEKILCMHGGLSPDLKHLDQIRNIARPIDVPDHGLLCDLLWADPDKDLDGWGENDRGVSFTFGADKVVEFLEQHDLDLICRAHQVVEDGYEFFAKRQLVTIFSAPNYCGEFDNAGAMMSVDDTLTCSFQILKSSEKKGKGGSGNNTSRPGTPPHKGGKN
ncbi:hypothetical protein VNO80_11774 [Phaseolus coccineus]|uniref:Serine/threonine-protein phosphatase n=1 Tax=Phaseolus coccineus TaxID=3886 RepID=A0AAN9NC95_PHACN